jgi:hypothetical protein
MSHAMKTGLNQLIQYLRWGCRVINSYRPAMLGFIENHPSASDAQKTAARNAIDAVMTACSALELFMVIREP